MSEQGGPKHLLVLADDLTGAADCAARCFAAGLPAQIRLDAPEEVLREPSGRGAVSLSSDSRHVTSRRAAELVRTLMDRLAARQNVRWYKKIDSTLRGNIGAELDAMLDSLAVTHRALTAVVSPAFPAQRRGVEGGYLVHAAQARTICLPELLAEQGRRAVAHIDLSEVRGDAGALAARMQELRRSGAEVLAVDAMTDEDLAALYAAALASLDEALFCGSAGLVSVLARHMAKAPGFSFQAMPNRARLEGCGPVVVAAGSGSAMAHAQIARLRSIAGCFAVEVGAAQTAAAADPARTSASILLFHLPRPAGDIQVEGRQARAMAARLAESVADAVRSSGANRLALVGGDTAVHVLARLGVTSLDVYAELQPGMPLATAFDSGGQPLAVVLKAGNHGTEDSLAQIVGYLLAGAQRQA